MDDDANKLLIEIRDILRESSESQAAWRNDVLTSTKRGQRIARFFVLPLLLILLSIVAWGVVSSSQAERERAQEERRYHEELKRDREELQRKMEERRNQLFRPKGDLGKIDEPGQFVCTQKCCNATPRHKCRKLEMTPVPSEGTPSAHLPA
jgi:hypothetical protein